ncbi:hypothetical protein [Acinetobacter beijerinckii]|uniref:hypothetical protein n=1 Tax=Acinetobacter beijerinckii TaxID=262668 RepID=UPI000697D552|nr:hypothetical protein [Acinetobacter beijerinckii]
MKTLARINLSGDRPNRWGKVQGNLSDQTDLNEALQGKTNKEETAVLVENINQVQVLAQTNELKLSNKADQIDFENAQIQVEVNRLSILTKADIQALALLTQLVDTKADQAYVNQQIADLVGSAPEALNTIYELAAAIQNDQSIIGTLNQSVANRVRFDVATQALTELQKQNARTNIGAEKLGTAQELVSQITAQSLGAATAAQGLKADTALQSVDVAPVALTGLFSSLANQNKIFDVIFNNYSIGSNTVISATDSLGQMLAKLQAQISNFNAGSNSFDWVKAEDIAGFTIQSPIVHKSLKFAKKDGLLWISGCLQATGFFGAGLKLFNISNPAYMIEQHVTNTYGAESQVSIMRANYYTVQYFAAPTNGNGLATFYVLGNNLYVKMQYQIPSEGGWIAFDPTPIGKLL